MSGSGTGELSLLDSVEVGAPLLKASREGDTSEYPIKELGERLESYLIVFQGPDTILELESKEWQDDSLDLSFLGRCNGRPVTRFTAKSQRFQLGGPYSDNEHPVGRISTAIWIWVNFQVESL
jgi:hypothetical protein